VIAGHFLVQNLETRIHMFLAGSEQPGEGTFIRASRLCDLALPLGWAVVATLPIGVACWWFAYRSDWF
jgi:hypothetical protein